MSNEVQTRERGVVGSDPRAIENYDMRKAGRPRWSAKEKLEFTDAQMVSG